MSSCRIGDGLNVLQSFTENISVNLSEKSGTVTIYDLTGYMTIYQEVT